MVPWYAHKLVAAPGTPKEVLLRGIHKLFAAGASILLLLLALAPAAVAAGKLEGGSAISGKSAKRVRYAGTTSQHRVFRMSVTNPRSGHITSGAIYWMQRCSGVLKRLQRGTDFRGGTIKNGRFRGHATYEGTVTAKGKAYTGQFAFTLVSHTSASEATGTWKIRTAVYSGAKRVSSCRSGQITWHATRP